MSSAIPEFATYRGSDTSASYGGPSGSSSGSRMLEFGARPLGVLTSKPLKDHDGSRNAEAESQQPGRSCTKGCGWKFSAQRCRNPRSTSSYDPVVLSIKSMIYCKHQVSRYTPQCRIIDPEHTLNWRCSEETRGGAWQKPGYALFTFRFLIVLELRWYTCSPSEALSIP